LPAAPAIASLPVTIVANPPSVSFMRDSPDSFNRILHSVQSAAFGSEGSPVAPQATDGSDATAPVEPNSTPSPPVASGADKTVAVVAAAVARAADTAATTSTGAAAEIPVDAGGDGRDADALKRLPPIARLPDPSGESGPDRERTAAASPAPDHVAPTVSIVAGRDGVRNEAPQVVPGRNGVRRPTGPSAQITHAKIGPARGAASVSPATAPDDPASPPLNAVPPAAATSTQGPVFTDVVPQQAPSSHATGKTVPGDIFTPSSEASASGLSARATADADRDIKKVRSDLNSPPIAVSPAAVPSTPGPVFIDVVPQQAPRGQAKGKTAPGDISAPSFDASASGSPARATTDGERDINQVRTILNSPSTPVAVSRAAEDTPSQFGLASNSGVANEQEAPPSPLPLQALAPDFPGPQAPVSGHRMTLRIDEAVAEPVQPDATAGSPLEANGPSAAPAVGSVAASTPSASQPTTAKPADPVEQVMPVLLTLAKVTRGSHEMTVRLQPAELGIVQVRIARAASGATQIEITAEKSATLLALQRDQSQLHRTLDQAGVPAVGRTVTFHAAVPTHVPSNSNGGALGGGQQSAANRTSAGHTYTDSSGSGGRDSYQSKEAHSHGSAKRPIILPEIAAADVTTALQSYRVGLDITA
jgi:flagellar hook-length control protein FliK